MALDYAVCAKEIYETLGGQSNLVSAAHCATRLRLVTVDNSKIDMKKLEDIDGVKGVFSNNGQLQLIIGTGTVNKVYEEFLKVSGMTAATKEEVKAAAAAKQPVFKRMIKALGDVFVPILPAIVASGLMMGLVEALGKAMPAFAGSDWYGILDLFANTAFTFLPILIAVSAARVFGGNIFLGAVIGMIMIHPNLINAWSVASMDGADIPVWHLLGFPIRQVGYQGHVIPVVIAVWVMSKLEQWLHKHVPEMIDLFVTPLCTVLITGFLTLGIIGPVFAAAEEYVLTFAQWIITVGYGVGAMIMGAVYPLTVVCGIHHMYNVIEAGMLSAADGLNTWMPIASAANFAQGAACLAVGIKAKNYKTKSVAIPSALSAALGITEPAIFGVNLRFMKPLVCGMIGGGAGALLGSIFHIGATSYGVTGIPGFLITLDYTVQYAIVLAVAFVVAFGLTWIVWKEDPEDAGKTEKKNETKTKSETTAEVKDTQNGTAAISTKSGMILAPVKGNVEEEMSALTKVLADQVRKAEEAAQTDHFLRKYRLTHHLMPPTGWLNDPNGLCYYKGRYHVFFQYSPFDAFGGLKFWGHYSSEDMINWRYEGVPLLPDSIYDCHGVYSGCAVPEKDKLHLFFSGNVKMDGDYDYVNNGRQASTLHVESEDGIHFGDKKVSIFYKDYPEDFTCHIRDPKVWKQDEKYHMVLGGRKKGDKGAVLFYSSEDMKTWQFERELTTEDAFGYMWECPDYFELGDKEILSVSPQGLESEEFRYQNIYQSGYFILKDKKTDKKEFREWDMGFDFYAPQTFQDEKGRRILIGWMGMPDADKEYTNPTAKQEGWQHCLTVPREVTYKNGMLYQYPAEELDSLRRDRTAIDEEKSQVSVKGPFDGEITFGGSRCRISLGNNLFLDHENGVVALSLSETAGAGRKVRKAHIPSGELKSVRILADTSAAEIFINHGEVVFSTRYYPETAGQTVKVEGDKFSGMIYDMEKMTVTK